MFFLFNFSICPLFFHSINTLPDAQMREIVPNESSVSTKLEMIGNVGALIRLVFLLLGLFLSFAISFAPPNTRFRSTRLTVNNYDGVSVISDPIVLSNFNPLCSFLIIKVRPFIYTEDQGTYQYDLNVSIQTIDNSERIIGKTNNIIRKNVTCKDNECDPIRIFEANSIPFESVIIGIIANSSITEYNPTFYLSCSSESPFLTVIAFLSITLMTVITSIILFCVVPRALKPSSNDHWATLFLGLFILLVDGPWLIMKYYVPKVASQIFDLSVELFHIVFFLTITYFVSGKTNGLPHLIFSSWVVRGAVSCMQFILIVVQFVITKLMPLKTLSEYIDESSLGTPLIVLTITNHIVIFALLIYGAMSLQIERIFVHLISSFVFIILELLYLIRISIRFWIPFEGLGLSFSGDLFYILMANVVTIFFLCLNLPIKKTLEINQSLETPLTEIDQDNIKEQ